MLTCFYNLHFALSGCGWCCNAFDLLHCQVLFEWKKVFTHDLVSLLLLLVFLPVLPLPFLSSPPLLSSFCLVFLCAALPFSLFPLSPFFPLLPCLLLGLLLSSPLLVPFHLCLFAVTFSSHRAFYGLIASMERSRSPRRSVSSNSHQANRALLPIRSSSATGTPDNLWKDWAWQGWYHHHRLLLQHGDKPAPTIPMGPRWLSSLEFYDYQNVNGLPLPRTIQPTAWSQSQNIAGYDPLTLPLSRVLRGGSANFWLRILASGKAVYLVPMGEVSHMAFVTAILTEFRRRGLDLTQVAQSRATQEGFNLEDSAALLHFASIMTSQLQAWIPNPQQEAQTQEKIAALQAELAALKSRTLPVTPVNTDCIYSIWFRDLGLDGTTRTLIEKNIVAVGKWWAAQPDEAMMSISRMATCFGIPGGKITSSQNKYLLEILKVAVTLTSWLSTQLKTSKNMSRIISALALCKHQIGIMASLSSLTLSSCINIFVAYRILQTRLMMLYVLHHPQGNDKLVAILRGTTCTRHLYGTTLLAHQQFSRSFFEPNTVYLRFTCIAKHQPLFYIGSTEDHTLGREHTRYRKFKQVSSGQFVLSELAIRFWSHSNNFFWWSPIPIYIRRANHWALEHALIQLWQPKLNYPFISQFFIPRKGIISKIPYSNTRQFGIASLWRKKRHKSTGKALRSVLSSPLFQSRARMWTLLQDLGSNTRRRFERTQYIRSTAFSFWKDVMHYDD